MHKLNYDMTFERIDDILASWTHRTLTPIGKIAVVNSLVNSLLVHKLLALPTPNPEFFEQYKKCVVNFIWNNKPPKIAYSRFIQDYNNLGLKLVDLKTKNNALKSTWPVRWSQTDKAWVYTNCLIKDARLWECNIKSEDVKRLSNNKIYRTVHSIWQAWAKFKYKPTLQDPDEILNTMLAGNSLIRRKNYPILDEKLTTSNIDRVVDIYNVEENRFMKHKELTDTFGPQLDYLFYQGILASIPSSWKKELKRYDFM